MKRMLSFGSALLMMLAFLPLGALAQDQQPTVTTTNLKVGDVAPDFTLPSDQGRSGVTLSSFKGKKNVILAFYVLAFTGG